jgi:hypothetical protein
MRRGAVVEVDDAVGEGFGGEELEADGVMAEKTNEKSETRNWELEKRDSSLRRPTLFRPDRNLRSQERKRKKKSACFVRSRNTIRDSPVETTGVQRTHKMRE